MVHGTQTTSWEGSSWVSAGPAGHPAQAPLPAASGPGAPLVSSAVPRPSGQALTQPPMPPPWVRGALAFPCGRGGPPGPLPALENIRPGAPSTQRARRCGRRLFLPDVCVSAADRHLPAAGLSVPEAGALVPCTWGAAAFSGGAGLRRFGLCSLSFKTQVT